MEIEDNKVDFSVQVRNKTEADAAGGDGRGKATQMNSKAAYAVEERARGGKRNHVPYSDCC